MRYRVPRVCLFSKGRGISGRIRGKIIFISGCRRIGGVISRVLGRVKRRVGGTDKNIGRGLRILTMCSLTRGRVRLPFTIALSSVLDRGRGILLLSLRRGDKLSRLVKRFCSSKVRRLLIVTRDKGCSGDEVISYVNRLSEASIICPLKGARYLYRIGGLACRGLFRVLTRRVGCAAVILGLKSQFVKFFRLLKDYRGVFLVGDEKKLKR